MSQPLYAIKNKNNPNLFWMLGQWTDFIYTEPILYREDELNTVTLPKDGEWAMV